MYWNNKNIRGSKIVDCGEFRNLSRTLKKHYGSYSLLLCVDVDTDRRKYSPEKTCNQRKHAIRENMQSEKTCNQRKHAIRENMQSREYLYVNTVNLNMINNNITLAIS